MTAEPGTYGPVTGQNGPSGKDAEPVLSVCIHCGLVLFDGLHRSGYPNCYMDEAPR